MKNMKRFYNKIYKALKRFIYSSLAVSLKKRYKLRPMRELSETEKQVVIRLVKWEEILKIQPDNYFQLNLEVLFGDLCKKYNSFFNIDFKNNIIVLKSTNELKGTGLAENNSFRRDFISLIHFIDYLKTEKLIYLVPTDPDVNQIGYERDCLIPNKTPFKSEIDDIEFIQMLNSLYCRDIYPTEYLTKYYKNDCKTDEEVRFKQSIDIANIGVEKARKSINVAIGIGVASIGLTIFTIFKLESKLDQFIKRFDKFEQRIELTLDKIDSRLERLEENDKKQDLRLDKLEQEIKTNR